MTTKKYEKDLFKPVQKYFSKEGYEVFGEVNDCDVVAVKDEELVIIELKLHLNTDLLIQATNRQRMTDQVYIAVPKPKIKRNSKKWHDLCHLIKRLELGLIFITFYKSRTDLEVIFPPGPFDRKRAINSYKKRREKLLEEVRGRHINDNIGGSSGEKIMTAYKESCIHIAYLLHELGPLSPKKLRELGTGEKTLSILNQNFYGWFERVSRGVYQISEQGKEALQTYSRVVRYYSKKSSP